MRRPGAILVITGALAVAYGGFLFNQERTILEIGSLQVTSKENNDIPTPAVAGAIVLIIGIGFVAVGARSPRRS